MGGLGSLRESLLLAFLCFAVWNEVISSHISLQVSYEEPVLPENQISIKMPGTSPQEVSVLLINEIRSWLVEHLIELYIALVNSNFIMRHDAWPMLSEDRPWILIALPLWTLSCRFARQEVDYLVVQQT